MMEQFKFNQAFSATIATMGGIGVGMGLSWTATALPSLEETGQIGALTQSEKSWIASILTIGALIACPLTGFMMNRFGRKKCLIALSIVGLPGWLLLASATHPDYAYAGRILTGIATGGYSTVIPVYIGEIASKENRGMLGSMFLIMLCLGKLFSNTVGILYSASVASLICGCHPIIYAVLLTLIPESPIFLIRKNKTKEATWSMTWLESKGLTYPYPCGRSNGTVDPIDVATKLGNIQKSTISNDENKLSFKKCLTSSEILKPSVMVFILMLLAQLCGINVTTFYTVEIFRLSGDILIDSKLATVILALIQTIACIPASIFVDKYGRKILLISSFSAMTVALAGFSVFFYIKDNNSYLIDEYQWLGLVPLISLVVYSLAYSWGVGSVVWIVLSEVLPPKIIGTASAIANVLYWGSAFLITQAFQMFKTDIPLYIWFATFSIVCVIGCVFNYTFLSETKGLSLQEIQAFYKKQPNTLEKPAVNNTKC